VRRSNDATTLRDATRCDATREPVDLARDLVTEILSVHEAYHLPNDRSVDAMLDHPWIICRSSVDHSSTAKREKKKNKVNRPRRIRSTEFDTKARTWTISRHDRAARTRGTRDTSTIRLRQRVKNTRTTYTVAARRKTDDGDGSDGTRRARWRNADPRALPRGVRAIAAARRGVLVKRWAQRNGAWCGVYVLLRSL